MAGRPISSSASSAWMSVLIWCERGVASPIFCIALRKRSRSSALSMASAVAPIILTPNFSRTPILRSDSAVLSAVCPPMVGRSAVRALLGDDLRHDLRRDRLDIGRVRQVRVGHDGRRIGIDQNDPVALFLERLAGLRAGIVELAGLADDDRSRADDQDRGDVGPFGHIQPCEQPHCVRHPEVPAQRAGLEGRTAAGALRGSLRSHLRVTERSNRRTKKGRATARPMAPGAWAPRGGSLDHKPQAGKGFAVAANKSVTRGRRPSPIGAVLPPRPWGRSRRNHRQIDPLACIHDPLPDACSTPANEAVVASGIRTERLRQVAPPDRKTQKMPLRTRRSFTRGTPRGLFGRNGLLTDHSRSMSS